MGNYPYLVPSFDRYSGSPFLSATLGPGVFLVEGLLFWEGALELGCGWVWGWGLGLGTKFALQFQICLHLSDEGGVGMESCAPGIAHYNLCHSVPPKHVDCSHFHFDIQSF